ncbi:hypothetical protein CLV90_2042 [Maribacter spongiicola]|uniref:Uncharacterized protein n=1 Tax=Maribacter spongiicola TaxID=1206753 RepID=A0A4R7K4J0_9FLAO|nr:hypothetical protein [Maribacter spongiicola]TDT44963.1 hypothetical protein CLV90_2042 [Maribacter spongiicola]
MNRYIKAMEIGMANEQNGISYFELVKQIEKFQGYSFGKESELSFLFWFSQNFSRSDQKIKSTDIKNYRLVLDKKYGKTVADVNKGQMELAKKFLRYKYWLDGTASKQYLDYLELQESRIASTQARKQSNISIWIALVAIILSTALGAYSIYSSPKTPYDVKIIEDKTKNIKFEKENKQLKEKLYKAELLIKVLEKNDSLNLG